MVDHEPAPGRLRLVQQFVNTVDYEHGREVLHEPAQLQRLLAGLGLIEEDVTVDEDDLRRAHDVRAALRTLALENNGGAADPDGRALLERTAANGRLVVHFDGRAAVLVPVRPRACAARSRISSESSTPRWRTARWSRLKACRREICMWLFYDRSRNRSARWCQMAVCGNRTKTHAYRTRRRVT